MKRIYNIMGVSILSIAVLSSCQKDEFIGKTIGETTKYTMTAEINNSDSRATVNENMEFLWHAHDALSVYDNTNNFKFSTINYFDEKQSNKAEFVGDAAFAEGTSEVTVIYPYKETEPTVLELPAEIEQTQDAPELKNTMFMAGKGNINEDKIENVSLKHLTALYQFKVKNATGRLLKLKNISVEASEDIFPLKLTYAQSSTSDNKTNKLTVNLNDKEFSDGSETNAYMNIFPTGNINDKTLTFKVVGTDEENKERKYEALRGQVSTLYSSSFNGYLAGKRYIVNLEISGDKEAGPDEGYDIDTEGKYHIYNAKGLIAWKEAVATNNTTNAVLEKNIDMSGEGNWTPIDEFNGIFNGNNKEISGLTSEAANIITLNGGTIKSLSIDNLNIKGTSNDNAGFVARNTGTLEDITIKSINMEVKGLVVGGLVGLNEKTVTGCSIQGGIIKINGGNGNTLISGGLIGNITTNNGLLESCNIGESALIIEITGNGSNQINAGGMVGQTPNSNATIMIKGCNVLSNAKISVDTKSQGTSSVGGFIGWQACGNIEGCSFTGSIESTHSKFGAFVGQTGQGAGDITLSYSAGSATSKNPGNTEFSGFIGKAYNSANQEVTSCYTTTKLYNSQNTPVSKDDANAFSALGALRGGKGGNGSAKFINCYYTQELSASNNKGGTNTESEEHGITEILCKKTVDEIRGNIDAMNKAATNSDYKFVANDSESEPLIIQKKGE